MPTSLDGALFALRYTAANYQYSAAKSFSDNANAIIRDFDARWKSTTLRRQIEVGGAVELDPFFAKGAAKGFAKKMFGKRAKWIPIPGITVGAQASTGGVPTVSGKAGVTWLGFGASLGVKEGHKLFSG